MGCRGLNWWAVDGCGVSPVGLERQQVIVLGVDNGEVGVSSLQN